MKKIFTLFATLGCMYSAQAQYTLAKHDVMTIAGQGSFPHHFTGFKGNAYFFTTYVPGYMWTLSGSTLALIPGGLSIGDGVSMVEMGGKAYLSGFDGPTGCELYEWDGVNNPVMLADMVPTSQWTCPRNLVPLNGRLYFSNIAPGTGNVCSYNPVTKAVQIESGNLSGSGFNIFEMVAFRGKLVFCGGDYSAGANDELYEFDPQTKKITLIADIYPGNTKGSRPSSFIAYNDKLYFEATDPNFGRELWSYDGLAAPVRVTDIGVGTASAFKNIAYKKFAVYKGELYFGSQGALYKYDAKANSTTKVEHLAAFYDPGNMTVYGSRLFFTSDFHGDKENTVRVYDGNGVSAPLSQMAQPTLVDVSELAVIGGRLYMSASDKANPDKEPWVFTDPVALGVGEATLSTDRATVYPNPTTSEAIISFTLKQSTMLNVELTDMQGRVVYTTEPQQYNVGNQQIKMPVQELATGIYIYTVMNEAGEILAKGQLVKK